MALARVHLDGLENDNIVPLARFHNDVTQCINMKIFVQLDPCFYIKLTLFSFYYKLVYNINDTLFTIKHIHVQNFG